jgi:hypothetical protein
MTSLPAYWTNAGYGVPNVCARHGEPATRRTKTQFISKPPTWAIPLAILGLIIYLIVVMAVRKTITVQNWPYCDQCRNLKLQRLLGGLGGLVLGILLFIVGGGLTNDDDTAGFGALLLIAGFGLAFAGLIVAAYSGRTAIAGGVVSKDGQFIELPKAEARFAAQVEAAANYAEQHARQQQAQYQQAQYPQPQYQQPQYPQPGPGQSQGFPPPR